VLPCGGEACENAPRAIAWRKVGRECGAGVTRGWHRPLCWIGVDDGSQGYEASPCLFVALVERLCSSCAFVRGACACELVP